MKKLILLFMALGLSVAGISQEQKSRLSKGNAYVGLSFGANFKDANNTNLLGLVNIVAQDRSGGNLNLNGGYFLGDHFSLGATLIYKRDKNNMLTEDSNGILTDSKLIDISYTTGVYIKYFTPLSPEERINLFARVGISYQDGRTLQEAETSDILTRTFTNYNTLNFGIVPGIQVLVAKGFAVEADISIAGLQSSWSKSSINGEPATDSKSTSVSFDINLLSLNIGFYYYF